MPEPNASQMTQFLKKQDIPLIYGATGYLGQCLIKELEKQNKKYVIGTARIENRQDLVEEVYKYSPTRIYCMAGVGGKQIVFWCDTHQIETIRANVIGQLNVADVATEFNIHCTIISSGVIYRYDKNHPINSGIGFKEDDPSNFEGNFYTKAKNLLEKLVKSYPNVLTLRVSYPSTYLHNDFEKFSFVSKLISYKKIQSIPLSVTIVDDLWPIMVDMAEKNVSGLFNFNNPGVISHDEILTLFKEHVNRDHQWELTEPDYKNRSAAELNVEKLLSLGYEIPHIKDSIRELIIRLGKEMACVKINKEITVANNNIQNLENEYTPKNVLLTGGAGFIGSHMAIHLVKNYKNYNVIVYDILDYCSSLKNLDEIKNEPNFRFVKGDICNFQMVKFVIEYYNIDTILHFAAQSHVDFSINNSLKFTQVNVLGTHVLLENARINNIKRFIHVSTDEVYGTTDDTPNLKQALEPTNPYACSKLAAECILMSYRKCFKLPLIVSRGNNVYGPHQFLEKVIPKFICRLNKNLKCCVHDDGSSERDFLYISDVVNAFDFLLHHGKLNEYYNIGASSGISILELAKRIVRIIKKTDGNEMDHIEFVKGRILDDKRYKINSAKIRSLGWKENVDFDQGLELTIDWYVEHQDYWPKSEYALKPHSDLEN
jgi:dTDP-glucose 4,6-dehydratase